MAEIDATPDGGLRATKFNPHATLEFTPCNLLR